MLKGKTVGSLYVLLGSTLIGAATVASSSLSDSDVTKLSHLRLGYMNQKGLAILSKKDFYVIKLLKNWSFITIVCLVMLYPSSRITLTYLALAEFE